ncbi:T9SS type A sorting domain-containing protein [Bacteroidota bacterium]
MRCFSLLTSLLMMAIYSWSQVPDYSLVGFATLNGGTTGGEGGAEVTVSNYAELKQFAEQSSDTPYIIYLDGTITGTGTVAGGNYDGSIEVQSNKSIIGLDSMAFLDGVGLTLSGGSNIIIQNLKISFISIAEAVPEGSHDIPGIYSEFGDEGRAQILVNGGDLISVKGESRNIWIDHCELFSEDPAVQPNKDLYDGLIDIKHQTGFITISWCYFHDHYKVHLIGANDTDLYQDRKITFHHNRYENVNSRLPYYRGAVGHVFNNYIHNGLGSCVNTRLEACVRVEKNYFETSKNPVMTSDSGLAERIDNKEVNCTYTAPYPGNCTASLGYTYDHVLTSNVDDVKNIVMRYAGVGKLETEDTVDLLVEEVMDILVYPNPIGEKLYISSSLSQEIYIELTDMLGQVVLNRNISGSDYINLSNLERGVYMMTLVCGNNKSIRKIIKK